MRRDNDCRTAESEQYNFFQLFPTFTQCAAETTEFGEITQNKAITPFKVIQGHRFWYQSKAHVRLPIGD